VETLKQLQEVVGNILEHIGIGNDFLSRTQKRKKMNKWGYIKLKSFCTAKEIVTTLETAHRMRENQSAHASYSPNKRLTCRIYRELKNSTPKESTSQ
jgi:transposase-like protein